MELENVKKLDYFKNFKESFENKLFETIFKDVDWNLPKFELPLPKESGFSG